MLGKLSSAGSSSVLERWAGLTAHSFGGVLNFHLSFPYKINKELTYEGEKRGRKNVRKFKGEAISSLSNIFLLHVVSSLQTMG